MTLYDKMGGRPALLQLLRHFYADVRQHHLIGPIFNSHIQDWPAHLEKIAHFWSPMLGGPWDYAGAMPPKHVPLGLQEDHFAAWLGLWEHNCQVWLPEEAANELISRAHFIAQRLREFCGLVPSRAGALSFRP